MNEDQRSSNDADTSPPKGGGSDGSHEKFELAHKEEEETRRMLTDFLPDSEEERSDIACGWGSCRPPWLQVLARKEVLILMISLGGIVQGMFFTYTVSVISTLEKRFKFSSVHTGIVLSGNDIAAILFAPFLGYYLNTRHRPRWIGLGIILTSASSFLCALPHFIYGPGEVIEETFLPDGKDKFKGRGQEDLCTSEVKDDCLSSSAPEEYYVGPLIVIFISQLIVGLSMSIFYSIGTTYIDDNISKKTLALYYSMALLLRTAGPISGFLLGGKCLEYWIVPGQSTNLTPKDPKWLGAWWLGFLLIGSGLLVVGTTFTLLPFKLPATLRREKRRILKQLEEEDENSEGGPKAIDPRFFLTESLDTNKLRKDTKPTLPNMWKVTKKLFKNKLWTANVFNTSIAVLAMSGYNVFKPKYLEHQFRKGASEANYYVGTASLVATCLGTIISGVVLRWIRPSGRWVTGYNIFVTLLGTVIVLSKMLISCPQLELVPSPSSRSLVNPECSSACECTSEFSPVCSEDNVTVYYSPCFAGCKLSTVADSSTIYSECSCIANSSIFEQVSVSSLQMTSDSHLGTATKGYCPEPCGTFIYYIVLEIIYITAIATGKIGSLIIHLRVVEDKDKGIAMGILEVCLALFGFIPAPLIMGKIIDSTCIIWGEKCGVRGNCWLYDTDKFRILLHSVAAGILLLSVLGDLVLFKYSHLLDLYGERETVAFPLSSSVGNFDDDESDAKEKLKASEGQRTEE